MNFKNQGAYKRWLAYGHASGEFAKTPGNQPVSIQGKPKRVSHMNMGGSMKGYGCYDGGSILNMAAGGPMQMNYQNGGVQNQQNQMNPNMQMQNPGLLGPMMVPEVTDQQFMMSGQAPINQLNQMQMPNALEYNTPDYMKEAYADGGSTKKGINLRDKKVRVTAPQQQKPMLDSMKVPEVRPDQLYNPPKSKYKMNNGGGMQDAYADPNDDPYAVQGSGQILGQSLQQGLKTGMQTGNPWLGLGMAAGSFVLGKMNQAGQIRKAEKAEAIDQGMYQQNQQMNSVYADPNSVYYSAQDGAPIDNGQDMFSGKGQMIQGQNVQQPSMVDNVKSGAMSLFKMMTDVFVPVHNPQGMNMAGKNPSKNEVKPKQRVNQPHNQSKKTMVGPPKKLNNGGTTTTPSGEKKKTYIVPSERIKEKQRVAGLVAQKKANPTKKIRVDFPGGGYEMR